MSSKKIEFLPVDTEVSFQKLNSDITGVITAIKISGTEHRVSYEVTWWTGAVSKSCDWFEPYQLTTKEPAKSKAGFIV